ncbi:MAG: GNAT family N-acetyltransferase [Chitinophagales bacterium]|nr:GNAT family N-acetyltransferase [Chitinophagales bacterium]
MKNIETERLILREFQPGDDIGMFTLDSDAEVHRYLGNNPISSIGQAREVIENVRRQYEKYGIGRWATIERSSGEFIGWSGLKFITTIENGQTDFYDVGYRFIPKYWGKGYATEATNAVLEYAFNTMNLDEVIGTCHEENKASRRVLEKCGLCYIEKYKWKDLTCDWLKITKEEWEQRAPVL